jgi:hypothetical protein
MQMLVSRAIFLASVNFHIFSPFPAVISQGISIAEEDVSLQLDLQKFHDYFGFDCTI